jgi:hypothetical protein
VILTVCLLLLFLLGFMGIALDFGHLFVVKTELQTSMDSCALAAAQELDGASDAITRARSAGITAGNLNNVDFQSSTWSGKGQVVASDITFYDTATFAVTTVPALARYVECAHTQTGVAKWLLSAMDAFSTATLPDVHNVAARAVATRANAQSACPVPLALKPKAGGTAPNYGFTPGEWVTLIVEPGGATNGQIGWANLEGSTSASETAAEMNGHCGTKIGDTLGTPGAKASVADDWNFRFGIYRGSSGPAANHPDYTGYMYTALNWPARANAYSGTSGGSEPTAANFKTKRLSFASCDDTGTRIRGSNSCESITGLSLNSFTRIATPGNASGGFRDYGTDRRIVTVPVVNTSMNVIDFGCMLMLQPLSIPMTDVQLEYVGNASSVSSPCTTSGLAGGTAGPLVPVLVR